MPNLRMEYLPGTFPAHDRREVNTLHVAAAAKQRGYALLSREQKSRQGLLSTKVGSWWVSPHWGLAVLVTGQTELNFAR